MTKKKQNTASNTTHDDIYQAFIEDCLDAEENKTVRDRVLYTVFVSWWLAKVGNHPPKIKRVADQMAARFKCFYSENDGCLYYQGAGINEQWRKIAEGPCLERIEETVDSSMEDCLEDAMQPLEDFSVLLNEFSAISNFGDLDGGRVLQALRGVYGSLVRQARTRIDRLVDGIEKDVGFIEVDRELGPGLFAFGDVISVKVR